ncbi:MAG: hypothetical protein JXJ04_14100 [Spirochaetales bacterium]|nr:hypothetical protein [Spirochaetales bacterium]
MNTKRLKLVYIAVIFFFLLADYANSANDYPLEEKEHIPLLSIGMSTAYSLGIGSNFFIPVFHLIEPSIFIRLFDLLDIVLLIYPFTLEIWFPGRTYHIGQTPLYRIQILLSPEIGIYFPSVGISYAYMRLNPNMFEGQDAFQSFSVSLAAFRVSLRKIFKFPDYMMPFVSIGELNYGSIIPNNRLPSFNIAGNFLVNIDFIRIGLIIHVL